MAKYHLGDDGQPRPCKATINCPKGGEQDHFEGGVEQARDWAEQKNAEKYGGSTANSLSKNVNDWNKGELQGAIEAKDEEIDSIEHEINVLSDALQESGEIEIGEEIKALEQRKDKAQGDKEDYQDRLRGKEYWDSRHDWENVRQNLLGNNLGYQETTSKINKLATEMLSMSTKTGEDKDRYSDMEIELDELQRKQTQQRLATIARNAAPHYDTETVVKQELNKIVDDVSMETVPEKAKENIVSESFDVYNNVLNNGGTVSKAAEGAASTAYTHATHIKDSQNRINIDKSQSLIDHLPTEQGFKTTQYPQEIDEKKVELYHKLEKGQSQIRVLQKDTRDLERVYVRTGDEQVLRGIERNKRSYKHLAREVDGVKKSLVRIDKERQSDRPIPDVSMGSVEKQRDFYKKQSLPASTPYEVVRDFRGALGAKATERDWTARYADADFMESAAKEEAIKRLEGNNSAGEVDFNRNTVKVQTADEKELTQQELPKKDNNELIADYEETTQDLAKANKAEYADDTYVGELHDRERAIRRELVGRLNKAQQNKDEFDRWMANEPD